MVNVQNFFDVMDTDELKQKIRNSLIVLSREIKSIDLNKISVDHMDEMSTGLGNLVSMKGFWSGSLLSDKINNVILDMWIESSRKLREIEKENRKLKEDV